MIRAKWDDGKGNFDNQVLGWMMEDHKAHIEEMRKAVRQMQDATDETVKFIKASEDRIIELNKQTYQDLNGRFLFFSVL